MSARVPNAVRDEQRLLNRMLSLELAEDPEAFVLYAFPWGVPNTPLANVQGPRTWQRDELKAITEHIQKNKVRMSQKLEPLVYQSATASGRGVGKSSLVAWINLWMMSTKLGSTCINAANSEDQLKSKTWAELGKWHTMAINSHWFDRQAMSLRPFEWFEKALKDQLKIDTGYYYCKAQLWSEEKPDTFAGAHNPLGMLVIFDEASGIPENIWSVTEGFFTEPVLHRYWFCFSNPRRNSGSFFQCFHKHRDFWKRRNLDSRKVEGTDKNLLNQILLKHGDDSDEARIEVKGEFPRQGDRQFISREVVEGAASRELEQDDHAGLIMGVDPARFGDDSTVICFRQGRNARVLPVVKMKGADNMAVANRCGDLINKYNPDAVCIDAGNGTGIIDRLREMGFKVHEVWFGSASEEPEWANKRTDLWHKLREWLKGGCIENDQELIDDLTTPEYKFQGHSDRIRLETKEEMKSRGMASPDYADALACTFAVRVARKDRLTARSAIRQRVAKDLDYSIFGD
jgi:hypothetical protein